MNHFAEHPQGFFTITNYRTTRNEREQVGRTSEKGGCISSFKHRPAHEHPVLLPPPPPLQMGPWNGSPRLPCAICVPPPPPNGPVEWQSAAAMRHLCKQGTNN